MGIKEQMKSPPAVAVLLISLMILSYAGANLFEGKPKDLSTINVSSQFENENCKLLYSRPLCKDDRLWIGFYNPNNAVVKNIEVNFLTESGADLAVIRESLPVNESRTAAFPLRLFHGTKSCQQLKNAERKLSWCCEQECYSVAMTSPHEDLKITTK